MSDESSNNDDGAAESSSDSDKESSSETAGSAEEREARKANARAVGLDTAFLDALGDEFVDTPAPAGKYGPGGTLVAENMDELEKVTGLPKTKLPPPPRGLSPKKERDEVLDKDFLQETTPTLELENKGEGEVLFESAAVESSESERLDLVSGPTPVVPPDDGLPDVLASFDSEASDPGQSGDALVVSVGPIPDAQDSSPSDEAAAASVDAESADVGADVAKDGEDDEKKAAVVAAGSPKPKPDAGTDSKPERAAAAAPAVAARPAANDGPDFQKYAVFGLVALLLLLGGYALMGGDDETKGDEVAKAGAAGQDKAAPAAEGGDEQGGGEAGGGGGGAAEEAGEDATPAGADAAAADAADDADDADEQGEEGEAAAGATDAEEAAADVADTEGAAAASTGEVDIEIDGGGDDDDGGGGGGGGGVAPISGNAEKKQEREAENEMTAKELREAAKAALKKRKYGDAYRLSGKAIRKESTEPAHAIRVEAACGLKNQAAAKSAFDHINTGKVRRDLRSACRAHDVRLGI